jgi:hypothetical protein
VPATRPRSPITVEALEAVIEALGKAAGSNRDDFDLAMEASFFAGATSLIASYFVKEDGSVHMTPYEVAQIVKEATIFAIEHGGE